jgi:predicted RNA-binding Zn-ribbon protein involved in translation (DUF1610 family)
MLPYRIVCADCGTFRIGRKRMSGADVIPYQETCSECGPEYFKIGGTTGDE